MAGLEVENVERAHCRLHRRVRGARAQGRAPSQRRPPEPVRVDAGAVGRFSVVCGAPNVRAGMTAPFARVGARLVGSGHGGGHAGQLEDAPPLAGSSDPRRALGGDAVFGARAGFFGRSRGHPGAAGRRAAGRRPGLYLRSDDTVLDIAITPNRGDCLSILGLAREIAALFGLKLKQPAVSFAMLKPRGEPATGPQAESRVESQTEAVHGAGGALAVEILAPELCPRYAGLPIGGVRSGRRRCGCAGGWNCAGCAR